MENCFDEKRMRELGEKLISFPERDIASKELRYYQDDIQSIIENDLKSLTDAERLLAFFVDIFIEDLFFNLAGDYVYHEKLKETYNDAWKSILTQLGRSFNNISSKRAAKADNYCSEFAAVVSIYYKNISLLNTKLMELEIE